MSAARLHRLQQLELELAEVESGLEAVLAALEGSQELQALQGEESHLEEVVSDLRSRQKAHDLELRGLVEKIAREEQQLYSGRVRNPKELQDLDRELEYLKRSRAELEEKVLELMFAAEERDEALQRVREGRQAAQEAWQRSSQELARERQRLESRRTHLVSEIGQLGRQVAAPDLATYAHLKRTKGSRPVAVLQGSLCQGCGVANPLAKAQEAWRGEHLVTCSSCGRILYAA